MPNVRRRSGTGPGTGTGTPHAPSPPPVHTSCLQACRPVARLAELVVYETDPDTPFPLQTDTPTLTVYDESDGRAAWVGLLISGRPHPHPVSVRTEFDMIRFDMGRSKTLSGRSAQSARGRETQGPGMTLAPGPAMKPWCRQAATETASSQSSPRNLWELPELWSSPHHALPAPEALRLLGSSMSGVSGMSGGTACLE